MEDFPLLRLGYWAKKGGLAVLDQGLFSGANFLVNILLARWLPPEEYGAFAVALSIFYLLAGFHTAVLTEPMMVFGAGKYREHFRKYLGMLLWGHGAISAVIAPVLGIAAFVMARLGSAPMAQALAGLAIASPFCLLLWLARRVPYVEMRPQWAVAGSGVNLLATLGGLFFLWRIGLLSSLTGLVLLGAAGAVASLALLLHIRPQLVGFVGNPTQRMIFKMHWKYGRWAMGITTLSSLSLNLYYLVLPVFVDLRTIGVFRALQNLILPAQQFIGALSPLMLSYFSRHASELRSRKTVRNMALTIGTVMTLYFMLLVTLGDKIMLVIYRDKYISYSYLLFPMGLYPILTCLSATLGAALRASFGINRVFIAYFIASSVFLTGGIPLAAIWGLTGAVFGLLVYGMTLIIMLAIEWRKS